MEKQKKVNLQIYSPRWGHEDTYELTLTRDSLFITQNARSARCDWQEDKDPNWSGENLESILTNDQIYPPLIFTRLITAAWRSWRNEELDDDQVERELIVLGTWLSEFSKAKPKTDFWKSIF